MTTFILRPRSLMPLSALFVWAGLVTRPGWAGWIFLALCAVAASHATEVSIADRSSTVLAAGKAVLILGLSFVPVAFDTGTADTYSIPKVALIATIATVAILLMLRSDRAIFRNGLHWPILGLIGVSGIATALGVNPRFSFVGAYRSYDGFLFLVLCAAVFFLACSLVTSRDLGRASAAIAFAAGIPVLFYAMIQAHDLVLGGTWDWTPAAGKSVASSLGNPNHVAGFLSMLFPLALARIVSGERSERVAFGVFATLSVAMVLYTRSQGGLVALALGGGVFGLGMLLRHRVPGWRPSTARAVAVGAWIVIILGVVAAGPVAGRVAERMLEPGLVSTVGQRFGLWDAAVGMGLDRPLFGFGPDSYRLMFPTYQELPFVQSFGPTELANGPHNLFLNQLATTGFVGLAFLVAVLVLLGARAVATLGRLRPAPGDKNRGAADDRYVSVLGAVSLLAAYLAQAMFNVQVVPLTLYFWAFAGLVTGAALDVGVLPSLDPAAYWQAEQPSRIEEPTGPKGKRKKKDRSRGAELSPLRTELSFGRSWQPARSVAVIATLVAGLGLLWGVTRIYKADRLMLESRESLLASNLPDLEIDARFQLVERGADRAEAAFEENPWEYSYARYAGRAHYLIALNTANPLEKVSEMRRAAFWYQEAEKLAPRDPEMLASFATILTSFYNHTGDAGVRDKAVSVLEQGFEINPWDPALAAQLVTTLQDRGDLLTARSRLREALLYRPDSPELQKLAEKIL